MIGGTWRTPQRVKVNRNFTTDLEVLHYLTHQSVDVVTTLKAAGYGCSCFSAKLHLIRDLLETYAGEHGVDTLKQGHQGNQHKY